MKKESFWKNALNVCLNVTGVVEYSQSQQKTKSIVPVNAGNMQEKNKIEKTTETTTTDTKTH